jgi:hypothetical protein
MNKTAERIIAISVFTLGLAACGGGKKEVAPTYHWVGGKPVDFTETEQSLVNRGYEAKARLSGEAIKDIDNSYALQDYGNLCAYFRLATIVGCLGAVALSLAFAFVGSYAGIPLGLAVIIATIATAAAMHLLATWAVTP